MTDLSSYQKILSRISADIKEAGISEPNDPNAASLATCTPDGRPSLRIVLLKDISPDQHFVFYTNQNSRKGQELIANPFAAMTLYWKSLHKQIRIEGRIEKASDQESDTYFATRSRGSQAGAWASQQSEILDNYAALKQRQEDILHQYEGQNIPRPPHWSGYRLIPNHIEFWQDGEFRLHKRELFTPDDINDIQGSWNMVQLNP